ncbi:hypothetical protein EOM71_02275, partial [Candidatus Falkowbacteria bacterium]|nr:hypothetical protein [Candidatus Falkowbacteria bacterium]
MKHGSKKILALSISFLAIILFISPIIARARCETKTGVTRMINDELVEICDYGSASCLGDTEAACLQNRMCCYWVPDNTTAAETQTQTQTNNQSQITGTIWQGARTEAVVQQSDPLVFVPQVGLPGFMERYVFNENSTAP